jgi:hypothetical protein
MHGSLRTMHTLHSGSQERDGGHVGDRYYPRGNPVRVGRPEAASKKLGERRQGFLRKRNH